MTPNDNQPGATAGQVVKLNLDHVFDAGYAFMDTDGGTEHSMALAFYFGCKLTELFKEDDGQAKKTFDAWFDSSKLEAGTYTNMRRAFDYAISLANLPAAETPAAATPVKAVAHDWVRCPVCDEDDMPRTTDADGFTSIHCLNGGCASNGGLNASALVDKLKASLPAGTVPAEFLEGAKELVRMVEMTLTSMEETHQAREGAQGLEGAAYFLALGAVNDTLAAQKAFERHLKAAVTLFRAQVSAAGAYSAKGGGHDEAKMKLVRDFVQMCVRRAGRQVNGDELSASATRLMAQLDAK